MSDLTVRADMTVDGFGERSLVRGALLLHHPHQSMPWSSPALLAVPDDLADFAARGQSLTGAFAPALREAVGSGADNGTQQEGSLAMDYFIDVTPLPGPANLFRDYGHESWDEIIEPTTDFAGCDTSIPLPCGPAGLLEH